jgi:hypothetical protein
MEDSNTFVSVTALICIYLLYIILVHVTVYLILALNFRSLVFTGVFQILLYECMCFKCIGFLRTRFKDESGMIQVKTNKRNLPNLPWKLKHNSHKR